METIVVDQPTGCVETPNIKIIVARSAEFGFGTNVATFNREEGLTLQVAFNPLKYIGTPQYTKTEEQIDVLQDPANYQRWLDDTRYMFATREDHISTKIMSIVCTDLRAIAFNAVTHRIRVVPDGSFDRYKDISKGFDQYIGDTSEGSFNRRLLGLIPNTITNV
ncbi:MAG: hypothetical protein ACI9T8_000556 [Candidatus Saccharimonadales bacterium]|jgi:hypothetical protein